MSLYFSSHNVSRFIGCYCNVYNCRGKIPDPLSSSFFISFLNPNKPILYIISNFPSIEEDTSKTIESIIIKPLVTLKIVYQGNIVYIVLQGLDMISFITIMPNPRKFLKSKFWIKNCLSLMYCPYYYVGVNC